MFNNNAAFNRTKFNCGAAAEQVYNVGAIAGIMFNGRVRTQTVQRVSAVAAIGFQGMATPARARMASAAAQVVFAGYARAERGVSPFPAGGLRFNGTVRLRAHHRGGITAIEGVTFAGAAKAIAHHRRIPATGGIVWKASSRMTREIPALEALTGIMFAGSADVKLRAEEVFSLSLTLSVGQAVIVDTENYTVIRDTGENVIQAHSGAWPKLQPGSYRFEIVANGPTANEVIYQEMWL